MENDRTTARLGRRDIVKRAVIAGGLAWTAPMILSSKVSATVGTVQQGDGEPTVLGTPGVFIRNFGFREGAGRITVSGSSSFACLLQPGNWNSERGTGTTHYRFDVLEGPATLTHGMLPAGQWHVWPGQGNLGLDLSFVGQPHTAYVIRFQMRYACCYTSTTGPSWKCWTSTASFTTGGWNTVGLVITNIEGSADCNTALPTC